MTLAAWIAAVTGILALGLAGYETYTELEREKLILEEIRAVHGQQTALSPMRQDAWGALLSGQTIDARLLGIGGL